MSELADVASELLDAIAERTGMVVTALEQLDEPGLLAPSLLPGWSRLTIACHLRYGALAGHQLTRQALAGRPAAFYPQGRERQRPATLEPGPGEIPSDVVASLDAAGRALDRLWRDLPAEAWSTPVVEPGGNEDLGRTTLATHALLRLTEVEVHGGDLGLGLSPWSARFVEAAWPFRVRWLATRRSNHRPVDETTRGSWLLDATNGPSFVVSVAGGHVEVAVADATSRADAVLRGTRRDLLALLLGRLTADELDHDGDEKLAAAFPRAFPGP